MAYRFLLEVPEELYEQANVVINHAPNAGITDTHDGIAGDFDSRGITITLFAHSLEVVGLLRDWYDDVRANIPDARPVNYRFMDGTRVHVADADPSAVVAAIRHDQPWVDRSIPKIGDHAFRTGPAEALKPAMASVETRSSQTGAALVNAPRVGNVTILATDEPTDHPTVTIDGATMLNLPMIDLFRAERAYAEVFGAQLVDRADRDGHGGFVWHNAEPGHWSDVRTVPEADYAFLQNGPLTLALERMGRAEPLHVHGNVPAPVKLLVPDASLDTIQAEALVRNWTVMDNNTPGIFVFRDPFGFTWEIHAESFEKDVLSDA